MSDEVKLVEHVGQSIATRRLFRRGQAILIAVSGGLDSMVLLHLLARLAGAHQWRLTVAHFNHQLRGRSSDADERLVQCTAEKLGLPFIADRGDVRQYGRDAKLSLEMAARKLRHEFLARVATKRRIRTIALAHHADDQVELFFVRLLRGAGGEGLAGMKWQSRSPENSRILLARPLLDQPKSALAAYARQECVPFREDASNTQLDIQRNRIRHELLPLLTSNYQPALTRVILRQMEIVGAEADFVNQAALDWLKQKKPVTFELLPLALQRRCLQLQLTQHGLVPNFDLIEQLRIFANRPVTVNERGAIQRDKAGRVSVSEPGKSGFDDQAVTARLVGRAGEIVFENVLLAWQRESAPAGTFRAPKRHVHCEHFDADKLGADIILRHWQPGDRFQPIGMENSVKLQNLFMNQKVPRGQRHGRMVGATAAGELFWVEGLRLGEGFKLDKNTRFYLKWSWKRLL